MKGPTTTRCPVEVASAVEEALTAADASPAARAAASEILSAAAALDSDDRLARHSEQVARVLSSLLVYAPFFGPILRQRPSWLLDLATTDLTCPRSATEMRQALALELEDVQDDASERLRRFKYRELARITARELSTDLVPDEREPQVLGEISSLADNLLDAALQLADRRLRGRLGLASAVAEVRGFVVLGLGKLGAGELNYSSDVDLIYVFDGEADPIELGLGDRLAPVEYFTRLAQELGRLVAAQGADGFLYRIDIELRPEGKQGPLVIAGSAFVQYYDTWAATWERAAAMKARPVAGDLAFGWKLIRALAPMLYRSSVDYESIAAIHDLKSRSAEARAEAEVFDVKYGRGGIRDVETIAQALQLVHGGQMPQVRQRSTEAAIQALEGVGVIEAPDAAALLAAYRFLRRLEHRIQMYGERQVYVLPSADEDLSRLGRSFGWNGERPSTQLRSTLGLHREAVDELMRRLFPEDTAERVMSFFASRMSRLLANTPTRDAMSELADHFAREIEGGPNPQRGLNNLERFIAGVGHRRSYYELLLDRPELVPRLATLFATSEHLSGYLATYPRLIEPIFNDPNVLLLTRAQLEKNFDELEKELIAENGGADTETQLDTLRLFHHRELVNVGLLDLVDKVSRSEAETALTEIAEVCLGRALDVARHQLAQRALPHPEARFLVVGMGKAASREITYGSDLDVIFLYDMPHASEYELGGAQDYFARLAQKLIWALCARTGTGVCYEVDARLRPSGNQGPLVTSMSGYRAYHAGSAQVWERQALLRARPLAGDAALGESFEQERRRILLAPLPGDVEAEVHRIRVRMEGELARETAARHDFKTGHGGLLDVETIVQLLQLRHLHEHPELMTVLPIAGQLEQLAGFDLLGRDEAAVLSRGWEFLQRLSSRLRIVENRSISDLDEERGDLESLARALGYSSPQRRGGARRALLDDYRHHTSAIREVYLQVIGAPR